MGLTMSACSHSGKEHGCGHDHLPFTLPPSLQAGSRIDVTVSSDSQINRTVFLKQLACLIAELWSSFFILATFGEKIIVFLSATVIVNHVDILVYRAGAIDLDKAISFSRSLLEGRGRGPPLTSRSCVRLQGTSSDHSFQVSNAKCFSSDASRWHPVSSFRCNRRQYLTYELRFYQSSKEQLLRP